MASASGGPEPFDARGWEEEDEEEQKPAEPAVSRAGKKPKAKAEGKKKSKAKNKKTKEEEETMKEKPNQVDDQVPEDAGAPMEALDQENVLDLLRDHFGECQTPPSERAAARGHSRQVLPKGICRGPAHVYQEQAGCGFHIVCKKCLDDIQ